MIRKGRKRWLSYTGDMHGSSRITSADVIAIREVYALGGISQQKLGERYGISQTQVSQIVLRKLWKSV